MSLKEIEWKIKQLNMIIMIHSYDDMICDVHQCSKIKVRDKKLAYLWNKEAEYTERPIRRLTRVSYNSTSTDMQLEVNWEVSDQDKMH